MLRRLAGQTAIYGVGTIVPRFLNYLLFPYLTRLMTTGEYGVVTDLYALIPFALVVLSMGLETGYFRFAGEATDPAQRKNIFANVWGIVSLAGILFFVLVQLFTPHLAEVMQYTDHPSYIRLVAGIVLLNTVMAIPFARLRQEQRAKRFMVLKLLSVVVNLVLTFFFYSFLPILARNGVCSGWYNPEFGAGYVLVADLISNIVVLAAMIPDLRGTVPRIQPSHLRALLIYSFPLLVSGVAGTANEFIDRQMIKYLLPTSESLSALGIYGAVAKLGVILILFTQMYRYAAEPYFLSSFKKEDFRRSNAEAMKYFIIVSIAIFLMITLFVPLFGLLMGRSFREGITILPVILLSNICAGIWLNLSFWYKKTGETKYAIRITGVGLIFTIGLNFLLTPVWGYAGAAWARLGCELTMVGVSYALCRKHYPIPYDLKRIGLYFLVGGAIYALSFATACLPAGLEYSLNFLLLCGFLLFVIRRERIDVRGMIRSALKR